jgi:hypothetical protein
MPYISEEEREELDEAISNLVHRIRDKKTGLDNPHDFSNYLGRINYCFSRVIGQLIKDPSYKKIAMITGVLENIKQEFYRRVASPYEDQKIIENGDISEYKS